MVKESKEENCFICANAYDRLLSPFSPCTCNFWMCQCCWFRITSTTQVCPNCRQNLEYSDSILVTLDPWIFSIHKIRSLDLLDNYALKILNSIAYFKPDTDIPLKLFSQLVPENELELGISLLTEHSLVTRGRTGGKYESIIVTAKHQGFSQRCFSVNAGIGGAVQAIQKEFGLLAYKKDVDLVEETFPHAFILWNHIASDPQLLRSFVTVSSSILYALDSHGRAHETLEFSHSALVSIRERFGENSPETYNAIYHYAFALMKVYKYQEAYDILHVFPSFKNPNENRNFVATLFKAGSCLAYCLYELGSTRLAVEFSDKMLEVADEAVEVGVVQEHVMSHIVSTQLYRNAKALIKLDRDDEAMTLLSRALVSNIGHYTEKSPKTNLTKKQLAIVHAKKGNYDEALRIYRDVQEIEREILIKNHPHNLTTAAGIAAVYIKMGTPELALKHCENILTEFKDHICPDNEVEILSVRRELGMALVGLKRYGVARAIFQEILDRKLEILGEKHPFISSAVEDLELLSMK